MGSHHMRIYSEMKEVELAAIVDVDVERARRAAARYGCRAHGSVEEIVADIDAATIAAPSSLHAEIGAHLLGAGVHCLIEKPLAHTVEGEVMTIEGLRDHPLIDAFAKADAVQCGFCTPGQVVSAAALVAATPDPTVDQIRHQMAGNICRCGTYPRIEEAIQKWRG